QVGALDRLALALVLVLDQAGEAATHDLAHHAVIVARSQVVAADVELSVLVAAKALRPGDDHAADGVGPLDVGVVIDLDAFGPPLQPEGLADFLEDLRLGRALGHAPAQRLAGVGQGVVDEGPARPALRSFDGHHPAAVDGLRLH